MEYLEYYKNKSFENLTYINPEGVLCIEEWKDVIGYEKLYHISNLGRVKSFITNKILVINKLGQYLSVTLCKNKKHSIRTVHRLVAIHFIPNPENKPEVNHKKGIKIDNRHFELEWNTKSENQKHAYSNGLSKPNKTNLGNFGKDAFRRREIDVYDFEGNLLSTHFTARDAAKHYGLLETSVSNRLNGRTKDKLRLWKYKN